MFVFHSVTTQLFRTFGEKRVTLSPLNKIIAAADDPHGSQNTNMHVLEAEAPTPGEVRRTRHTGHLLVVHFPTLRKGPPLPSEAKGKVKAYGTQAPNAFKEIQITPSRPALTLWG